MWNNNNEELAKGYTGEANEIQKSIDQIGYDPVEQAIKANGRLAFCDMHGYYLTQSEQLNEDGTPVLEVCPLCITHDPKAEGTPASEVELFIDLRDQLENAVTHLGPQE